MLEGLWAHQVVVQAFIWVASHDMWEHEYLNQKHSAGLTQPLLCIRQETLTKGVIFVCSTCYPVCMFMNIKFGRAPNFRGPAGHSPFEGPASYMKSVRYFCLHLFTPSASWCILSCLQFLPQVCMSAVGRRMRRLSCPGGLGYS